MSMIIVTKGRFSKLREIKPDWSGFQGEARKQESGNNRDKQCMSFVVKFCCKEDKGSG